MQSYIILERIFYHFSKRIGKIKEILSEVKKKIIKKTKAFYKTFIFFLQFKFARNNFHQEIMFLSKGIGPMR
jgi:hypothetical protein